MDKKNVTGGSKDAKNSTTEKSSTGSKFPGSKAKKEVEENPFKKLIDISDLMEFESNQAEVLKEI